MMSYTRKHKMSLVLRKPAFCICENKDADQLCDDREADQRLYFLTQIVQSLFFLNPTFQAASYLLRLHSLVCVGPGRKPRRPVFSERGSNNSILLSGGRRQVTFFLVLFYKVVSNTDIGLL